MSKEMLVIALGLWIIIIRTVLGIPGSWQTALFIVTGVALAVIGFQLRGEALMRSSAMRREAMKERSNTYTFVESPTPSRTASREENDESVQNA